ncbi:MAG: ribonuclease III [Clostridiales bacterium GWF2_38_85]|nr:MAG: ribonuclease III [Clostridiales bacterium GWF2_38_85]HBL83883.1 ribonuclease III [Clostridiales bacterium]
MIEPLPLEFLEEIVGYKFKEKKYILTALTHSSYINEAKAHGIKSKDNERMEFLGDSVLSIVVTDYLFRNCRSMDEGGLTRMRAAIVCEDSLAEKAATIKLGEFMLMGHGEVINDGRNRKSIIADAFEAVIAAIYIDGGIVEASKFLLPFVVENVNLLKKKTCEDFKSLLQRFAQQSHEEVLEYEMVEESGPPHERQYTFNVKLNNNIVGVGAGRSKRQAEQNAAFEALKLFDALPEE